MNTILLTIQENLAVSDDGGFTLVELMMVVLIIAILIAIAIPTFVGARQRAQDRSAQTNIRNAFTAERTYYADNQQYIDNSTTSLTNIEPSIQYGGNVAPATIGWVYVSLSTTYSTNDTVVLGALSGSGTCFYLKDVGGNPGTTYGNLAPCVAPGSATVVALHW